MLEYHAFKGDYYGEPAVWLKAGRYEAAVLPQIGGNLIAFRDIEKGFVFLREPGANGLEDFKAKPGEYGIPVLFPPNRYDGGTFPWNGKVYQLPVNETDLGNHLHGFVHKAVWNVEDYGTAGAESYVTLSIRVDRDHEIFTHFPHQFTLKLRYALGENGLSQHTFVKNDGVDEMPCLLAYHTAVNAPFAEGSTAQDYSLKLTVGKRWELNERKLPTGRQLPLSPEEESMKGEGVNPYYAELDHHYTAAPQNGRNRMELTDKRLGVTLVYDVGTSYKQWMLWNKFACGTFFCPEPQINLVNAPNTGLPAEEIGLFGLAPGEIWEETARIYVK